jgi:hypothetical protein
VAQAESAMTALAQAGSVATVSAQVPAELAERSVGPVTGASHSAALCQAVDCLDNPAEPVEYLADDSHLAAVDTPDYLQAVDNPGFPDNARADDKPVAAKDTVACNSADDSPSCRHIPDSPHNKAVAGDTRYSADDSRQPRLRPTGRDCSRHPHAPNPIPSHPIPTAGYCKPRPRSRSQSQM